MKKYLNKLYLIKTMDKKTTNEIKQLRKSIWINYESYKKNYQEIGLRLFELSKQADLLLNCIEELNKVEVELQ